MQAIEKFQKHNNSPWFKKFKSNTQYKSFYEKNKYFFNELYKIKAIPTEDLVFVLTRILKHNTKEPTKIDMQIKQIARGFVIDHHELFPEGVEDGGEELEDAYDGDTPKYINSTNKNMSENDVKSGDKNMSEKRVEKHDSNAGGKPLENDIPEPVSNTVEKIEEIKKDVEQIEEIQKEHPNFKHIEAFHSKIEELKEDIHKKFNDMIDAHMDLKKSIEEKRNISNHDAKSRIENMEGKIEMLYGKQMEESTKHPKQSTSRPKTKTDMLHLYVNKKLKR